MSPKPSTAQHARTAELIRLAAEPKRAEVIVLLADRDLSGAELIEATGCKRTALSGQLQTLRAAGVVQSDRGRRESRHSLTSKGRTLLGAIEALGSVG